MNGHENKRILLHKRSTKEVLPWNGHKNILLEGLNKFHGTNLTLISDVDQDTKMFGLHERPLAYQCIISKNVQIKVYQGDKAKIRIKQYIKLNIRAKEIQQVSPSWPYNSQSIRPLPSHQ